MSTNSGTVENMETVLTRLKWEGPVGGVVSMVTPGDVTSLHCPVKSYAEGRGRVKSGHAVKTGMGIYIPTSDCGIVGVA